MGAPTRNKAVAAMAGALALVGTIMLGASPPGGGAAGPAPPSVLMIQTDDQTTESLRFMDAVRRRIVRRGTQFANAIVTWPLCCPSRASVLSGQYTHNHGVLGNNHPDGGVLAFDDSDTVATRLDDAGYLTAHVGKYLHGYGSGGDGPRSPRYVPPGWDQWHTTARNTHEVYDYGLARNGRHRRFGTKRSDFKQDVFTRIAAGLIRRLAPRQAPLFLAVDYTAPHSSPNQKHRFAGGCSATALPARRHLHAFDSKRLPRPPGFDEANVSDKPDPIRSLPRLDRGDVAEITRRYRCRTESLLAVDEGVAALLKALKRAGELERTLIIFTSDNGFFAGEHRVPGDKNLVYEPAARVPLVIRGPGVPAGRRIAAPVSNADLAPTVLDSAGLASDPGIDGRSLLPLAADPGGQPARSVLIETKRFAAIRTSRYLYAEHRGGELELYDLARDPHQLESVHSVPAYSVARVELGRRLDLLQACAGASCAVSDYGLGP